MFRLLFRTILFLVLAAAVVAAVMKFRYGGATVPFPVRPETAPMLPGSALEVVAKFAEAPGNIAVSPSGRVFFNFHPEGRPESVKVAELVNGQPVAFPDEEFQHSRGWGKPYFDQVFSVRIDAQNRLWTLDTGFHGLRTPRLLAFDLDSRKLVHQWDMPSEVAGIGSYVQDFQVAPDGLFIFLADVSALGAQPAIIVYDVSKQEGRRVLEADPSTTGRNYSIVAKGHEMSLLGGLYKMHPGVDSIALDFHDAWLYFGPMSHEELFRVPSEDLRVASRANIAAHVEKFGPKPQSDGLTMDTENSVYITDVEHGAISVLNQKHELKTLIRDERIRWADGMGFGPDGWLYFTDSDIPDTMMQSREHIKSAGPYYIFRVQTGKKGRVGH